MLHSADLLNPDQPPFLNFAGNERFLYQEDNLKAYAEVARLATEKLRPVYGKYYGFDTATPANAEMVAEYLYNYR